MISKLKKENEQIKKRLNDQMNLNQKLSKDNHNLRKELILIISNMIK